jgi:hypothetical protein
VLGNTWAWPKSDPGTQLFSRFLGGPVGRRLIQNRNLFVEKILPGGVRRRQLPEAVMDAYRGPFPTPRRGGRPPSFRARSSRAGRSWPRSPSDWQRCETARRCSCGRRPTSPSASRSGGAGRSSSRSTTPCSSRAPATTSRRTRPRRSSRRSAGGSVDAARRKAARQPTGRRSPRLTSASVCSSAAIRSGTGEGSFSGSGTSTVWPLRLRWTIFLRRFW